MERKIHMNTCKTITVLKLLNNSNSRYDGLIDAFMNGLNINDPHIQEESLEYIDTLFKYIHDTSFSKKGNKDTLECLYNVLKSILGRSKINKQQKALIEMIMSFNSDQVNQLYEFGYNLQNDKVHTD